MSSPLPPHVKKAPPRSTTNVPEGKSTLLEYVKFWLPFLGTIVGAVMILVARLYVVESTVEDLKEHIQRIDNKTMERETLNTKFEACDHRHDKVESGLSAMGIRVDNLMKKD